ncbi:MAG: TVP38/TMEM64 family protein [Deltaproteobacteria bacterium]|nr:TVP38/TMEM64 family protein [Deltaproteobacteria bacterium]
MAIRAQRARVLLEEAPPGSRVQAERRNQVDELNNGAPARSKKRGVLKALVFVAFIIVAIYVMRFTPVKDFLTADALGRFLDSAGIWAPIAYMVVYAVGVCLFLPGTLLTGLGAALFGAYWGFIYVWIGAMLGASAAFWIGRTLGRDFAASLVGDKLKKYDDAIGRNGFATVLYLRLIYFPFTPMNFGMGITKVRFRDYFFGTGLGIIVGTFVFTFFIGTVKEVWFSGNWGELVSFKVFFSISLFVFSFFIPKIIKKIRGEEARGKGSPS